MKQRIVTGVLAGLAFAMLVVLGGWYYKGLLLILALIGFYEYIRLNGYPLRDPLALLGLIGMLAIAAPLQDMGLPRVPPETIVWSLMFALLAVTVLTKNRATLDGSALMLMGAVYVGFGFSAMMAVRGIEPGGLFLSALTFGAIWASDAGAYFVGKTVGRHKLWPAISPNKTIEGALGGVLLSLIVCLISALVAPEWISVGRALTIGIIASVAGQLGDLIQSAYKRLRGVKDSGKLLPGHGGVLDRCDSWLIVFPLLTLTGVLG
ncbi:phosphatidate cytidylyltransferase [uncultured Paenibacillus sp.]|uniref:phosphatidate cytidylyltransferase n=1 Tax=uncultured Paenibacillus sp. TaxID=227322 RepID=UPI0028D2FEFA|nr:phosphatidate cytidylyltransferase [uncultured Paenibacillus sp.]